MAEMSPVETPSGECAHCPNPATKFWRLLGGDDAMGFGHRPVCGVHFEAEREQRNAVLRDALERMRRAR